MVPNVHSDIVITAGTSEFIRNRHLIDMTVTRSKCLLAVGNECRSMIRVCCRSIYVRYAVPHSAQNIRLLLIRLDSRDAHLGHRADWTINAR